MVSRVSKNKSSDLKKVLVFHDGIFRKETGSTERLLRDMLLHLLQSGFAVCVVCSKKSVELIPASISGEKKFSLSTYVERTNIKTKGFNETSYSSIREIISAYDPDCILATVWTEYQHPLVDIPRKYPLVYISPFGHYCSNGNVRSVFVSGYKNTDFLKRRGITTAKPLFNPIKSPTNYIKKPSAKQVVFCRTGRGDDSIFDPISLRAFSLVEKKYGKRVLFRYVNPSPRALALAKELKLKQVEFSSWLTPAQLSELYHSSHIFAHARYDGETAGISIAEAMLHGCPVVSHISHHNNDHTILLKKPFGLIAPCDDFETYASNMSWFVEHHKQIGLHSKLAHEHAKTLFDEDEFWRLMMADFRYACKFKNKPMQSAFGVWLSKLVQGLRALLLRVIPISAKEWLKSVVTGR